MANKFIKVYIVTAKSKEKKEHLSFFAYLFGGSTTKIIYDSDFMLAVFSTKEEAEKYIKNKNNLIFDFKPKDCSIHEWWVDYPLYWREWNKREKVLEGLNKA